MFGPPPTTHTLHLCSPSFRALCLPTYALHFPYATISPPYALPFYFHAFRRSFTDISHVSPVSSSPWILRNFFSAFSSSVPALCRPGLVFLFVPWGAPAESLEVTQRISIGSDTALQVRIQVTKYPAAFSSRQHPHQAVPPTTNASSLQHNLSPAPLA